jgi:hypothetical protein
MGYCNHCGAPCSSCTDRTDFSLLRLSEPVREKVKRLLDETGVQTNQRASKLIAAVAQYPDATVLHALRVWSIGHHAAEGKDERYFLGILRSVSVAKKQKLDSLPPLVEYDELDDPLRDGKD